jgi:hypothetical protein
MKTLSVKPTIQKLARFGLIALAATSLSVVGATALRVPATAQQPSIRSINPNVALDGHWNLEWRLSGIRHRARLSMNGNFGTMIVNVRLPNGKLIATQQTMTLTPNSDGFMLRGSTPTYPGTKTPFPNYNPDVFQIQQTHHGSLDVTNCSSGSCVAVTMRSL